MKVTILGSGTSHGIPVIGCHCPVCSSDDPKDRRLRSSAYFSVDGVHILIDAGPDFRQQVLRAGIEKIDAILLTHEHRDHIGGLDDVRSFNYMEKGIVRPMPLYGNSKCLESVRRDYSYAFAEKPYLGVPLFDLHVIGDEPFYVKGIRVQPIPMLHYRLPVCGYRIGDTAYLTDLSYLPAASVKLLQGIRYLIIDTLRIAPHISHLNLEQALEIIRGIPSLKESRLIHICHAFGKHQDIMKILPEGISPAYDGEVFDCE